MRLCLPLLLLLTALLRAAELPDWAKPHLTPEALVWENTKPSTSLFDETELHYESPVLLKGTRRSITVIHLPRKASTHSSLLGYDSTAGKTTRFAAWMKQPNGKVITVSKDLFIDTVSTFSHSLWNHLRSVSVAWPEPFQAGSILVSEISWETTVHPILPKYWRAAAPLYLGRFSASPPPGCRLVWAWDGPSRPPPTVDPNTGRITWQVSQYTLPDTHEPAGFLTTPVRVAVTCPTPETPLANWRDFARAVDPSYAERTRPAGEVVSKAAALIAGKTTRWEKVRALTDFIQAEISYLNMDDDTDILTGQIPQFGADCIRNRYGDCKDKATLLVSLLRAIGDEACVLLVYARNPSNVFSEQPISSFNHAITAIPADADVPPGWPVATHPTLGRFVIVDTTSSANPLGTLPRHDQGGLGLLIHPEGDLLRLPVDVPGHHGAEIEATIRIHPNGNASLHLVDTSLGQRAANLQDTRDALRKKKFTTHLEERVAKFAPRIHDLRWSETIRPNRHELTVDCQLLGFVRKLGPELRAFTPPVFSKPPTLQSWPPIRSGRFWLALHESRSTTTFQLPEGTRLAEPAASLDLEADGVHATYHVELVGSELRLHTSFLQPAGFFEKDAYESLRKISDRYLACLKRPILLQLPAPDAGQPVGGS